jgi:hypothetical protein
MNGVRFLIGIATTCRLECGGHDCCLKKGLATIGAVWKSIPVKERMPRHLKTIISYNGCHLHNGRLTTNNYSTMKKVWFQGKNRSRIDGGIISMRVTDCPPMQAGSD